MISLILIPSTQANNEIVNFGPIMCAADEHGHLQSKAAKQVSKDWPLLKVSNKRQIFSLDPINQPDVWISLAISEEDEKDISTGTDDANDSFLPIELESKSFPLITREEYSKISPRDRWLKNFSKNLYWNLISKKFSFRIDWSANFPIKIIAKVHSPHSMLAVGKTRWHANEHQFEENQRTEEQDLLDSPLWPCPRVYVHLHVEIESIPIPSPSSQLDHGSDKHFSFYKAILKLSERYLAPLTNPGQNFDIEKDKIISTIPVHLILDHLYFGFFPHTSISLFFVLIPLLLLTYLVILPIITNKIQKISNMSNTDTSSKRKNQ